jgi:hypothetical protein
MSDRGADLLELCTQVPVLLNKILDLCHSLCGCLQNFLGSIGETGLQTLTLELRVSQQFLLRGNVLPHVLYHIGLFRQSHYLCDQVFNLQILLRNAIGQQVSVDGFRDGATQRCVRTGISTIITYGCVRGLILQYIIKIFNSLCLRECVGPEGTAVSRLRRLLLLEVNRGLRRLSRVGCDRASRIHR